MRRFALPAALAAIALAALPALAAATSIAGPNGKIVFASGRPSSGIPTPEGDKQARIWVADYPSGTPVQVTTQPSGAEIQHRHPNWSPDHSQIVYAAGKAFSGEYALWIVDLRTGAQTEFAATAKGQDRPTWSPDGTRIAYGSGGDLWVKAVAPGSTAVQLTNTPAITEERPVWSPDGNTLYYNRGAAGNRDIFRKSPVTPAGAEEAVIADATDDWQPALSPNGSRLCYLRGAQDNSATLRTINVNGTGDTPFLDDPALGDLNCVWSPNGARILYTEGAFEVGQLRTRDLNAGGLEALDGMNVPAHFDGNADWATNFSPSCDAKSADVAVNGFVKVGLSCTDPDAGFGAEPPTATPIESDAIEIVARPSHGTIGGIQGGAVIYTSGKDFSGADTFTYTAGDGSSDAAPATVTVRVDSNRVGGDRTPPSISGLGLAPKRWRLGHRLASISRLGVGTTISFRLSEAARVTLAFKRTSGRGAGSISVSGRAGLNHVRFQGRLDRRRTLAPGRYRLLVSARDAAGNESAAHNGPKFTIVTG